MCKRTFESVFFLKKKIHESRYNDIRNKKNHKYRNKYRKMKPRKDNVK